MAGERSAPAGRPDQCRSDETAFCGATPSGGAGYLPVVATLNTTRLHIDVRHSPVETSFTTDAGVLYFVGANGAGKTRLLEAFDEASEGRAIIRHHGASTPLKTVRVSIDPAQPLPGFDFEKANARQFSEESAFLERHGHPTIELTAGEPQVESRPNSGGGWTETKTSHLEPTLRALPFTGIEQLSHGLQRLYGIENWDLRYHAGSSSAHHLVVATLDEPETGLHPDRQRELPSILEAWAHRQPRPEHQQLLILVATHSPFVIKGASQLGPRHQVCVIRECNVVPIGRGQDEGLPASVSGAESLVAANTLLGAGMNDLVPSPLIYCENSIAVLLEGHQRESR